MGLSHSQLCNTNSDGQVAFVKQCFELLPSFPSEKLGQKYSLLRKDIMRENSECCEVQMKTFA